MCTATIVFSLILSKVCDKNVKQINKHFWVTMVRENIDNRMDRPA